MHLFSFKQYILVTSSGRGVEMEGLEKMPKRFTPHLAQGIGKQGQNYNAMRCNLSCVEDENADDFTAVTHKQRARAPCWDVSRWGTEIRGGRSSARQVADRPGIGAEVRR